jgi:hypothetical protein
VVVHSCLKALLFIAGHGMGRHRDNRYWILEDESSSESLSLSFELSAFGSLPSFQFFNFIIDLKSSRF